MTSSIESLDEFAADCAIAGAVGSANAAVQPKAAGKNRPKNDVIAIPPRNVMREARGRSKRPIDQTLGECLYH